MGQTGRGPRLLSSPRAGRRDSSRRQDRRRTPSPPRGPREWLQPQRLPQDPHRPARTRAEPRGQGVRGRRVLVLLGLGSPVTATTAATAPTTSGEVSTARAAAAPTTSGSSERAARHAPLEPEAARREAHGPPCPTPRRSDGAATAS